jgi:hypothetical protein
VGIRLQNRFVVAEKAWIFSGRPPLTAKQPFSEPVISSTSSAAASAARAGLACPSA